MYRRAVNASNLTGVQPVLVALPTAATVRMVVLIVLVIATPGCYRCP